MAGTMPFVPALDAESKDPDAGTRYSFPRDLVGYGRHPPNAEWPGGAKIAVSFVINYEEVSRHACYRSVEWINLRSRVPNEQC